MKNLSFARAAASAMMLVCVAATAWAAYTGFYWKPDSDNTYWTTCANWSYVGDEPSSCVPATCGDKVTIGYDDASYTITVSDLSPATDQMHDLLIQDDVTFGAASGTINYYFNSIEIQGESQGGSTVTINAAGVTFHANACGG